MTDPSDAGPYESDCGGWLIAIFIWTVALATVYWKAAG